MFREPKPGYLEVMELLRSFDGKLPSLKEVELAISSLYDTHKDEYRAEIEAQDMDWDEERRNDPWKGLYNYKHVEYRDLSGRFVPEEEARSLRFKLIFGFIVKAIGQSCLRILSKVLPLRIRTTQTTAITRSNIPPLEGLVIRHLGVGKAQNT
ncbi:MAG: adenine-specific DNA-methyltransferase [Chthoniobacter sp.]|jgi:hypothetical protein|nr:adenine-specific DNA-methyltransferase [Chthoniobacter sp.]